jgi:hypothetical protein
MIRNIYNHDMHNSIPNRFFNLPRELILTIYEFDNTYHDIFKNSINELKILNKSLNYFKNSYNLIERLNNLDDNMKNNKFFIKYAIKKNALNYRYASNNLKHKLEIINFAVERSGLVLDFVPQEIVENDDYYYLSEKAIENDKHALQFCCSKLRSNKSKVLFCIRQPFNVNLYRFISNELKRDSEIIDYCLTHNSTIYLDLPEDIKENLNIIHKVLENSPSLYRSIPYKYKTDKEILFRVLKKNYNLLEYFPEIIKNDNEILIKALQTNLNSLNYFKKRDEVINKEIISISLRFLKKNVNNFKKFPREIQLKEIIVIDALRRNIDILDYVPPIMKENKYIIETAINQDIKAFKYASITLKKDNDILDIIKKKIDKKTNKSYKFLENLPDYIIKNNKLMFHILVKHKNALKYFPEEMRNNINIVYISVSKYPDSLKYASKFLQNDKNIVLEAVKVYGNAYKYASDKLKDDEEIVLLSYKNSKNFFHYYSEKNKNLILKNNNKNIFRYYMNNSLEEKKIYGFGINYMMIGIILLVALVIFGGISFIF